MSDTPQAIGPVWIVAPGGGGAVPPAPGDGGAQPEHPIVLPPDAETPGDAHPEHPIVLPPDLGIWPNPPEGSVLPEHPIVIPPDITAPPDGAHPAHPIYIDAYPDNSLPVGLQNAGEPEFYQRKTLGINWDKEFDKAKVVGIYASSGGGEPSLVRQVANDGSSSVTYPQDFTGEVTIRVAGMDYYLEGTTTVQ
jgi:hypothetical protein